MEDFLRQNLRYCPLSGELYWTKENGNSRNVSKPVGTLSNRNGKVYKVFGARIDGKDINLYCHRVAWFLFHGHWPENHIDHADGDGCNNKITNLRLATITQNMQNTKKRLLCSSKFKGVSWSKSVRKWHGYVTYNKKRVHLGYFDTEEDAALAYDRAAKQLFGDYAKLNFPETDLN